MKYQTILKSIYQYNKAKKEKLTKPIDPYRNLKTTFIMGLVETLSTITLHYKVGHSMTDALVLTSETLKTITDEEVKAAVEIAYMAPRSKLLGGLTAAENPKYAGLTPLLMFAHPDWKYEQWDKTDSLIHFALGGFLTPLLAFIKENDSFTIQNLGGARQEHLGDRAATSYNGKAIKIGDVKLPGSKCFTKMLLQTWIANAQLRVPGAMILDPWDWNNVPLAFDEVSSRVVAEKVVKNVLAPLPWTPDKYMIEGGHT